jgi:hypothetical protein
VVARLSAASAVASISLFIAVFPGGQAAAQAQTTPSGTSDLSVDAMGPAGLTQPLFPGATGDVAVVVSNPNSFAVSVTALELPPGTAFASGYADSSLSTPRPGCGPKVSLTGWSGAAPGEPSWHVLTSSLTIAARSRLQVDFTGAAYMGQLAPAACQNSYFRMPSLIGILATGTSEPSTSGPVQDSWGAASSPTPPPVPPPPPPTTVTPTTVPSPAQATTTLPTPSSVPESTRPAGSPTTTAVPTAAGGRTPGGGAAPGRPGGGSGAGEIPKGLSGAAKGLSRVLKLAGKVAESIGQASLVTLLPAVLILLFLLLQDRIDREDPKLAMAPLTSEPDLEFPDPADRPARPGPATRSGRSGSAPLGTWPPRPGTQPQ